MEQHLMYFLVTLSCCVVFVTHLTASLCSENCSDVKGCDNGTDTCLSCKDGWYGNTCNYSCNSNCAGTTNKCDVSSGSCIDGCRSGWHGEFCNLTCEGDCIICNRTNGNCLTCKNGYWGSNCKSYCHENCIICEKETGVCQGCKGSTWGQNCENNCTQDCRICNQDTGKCILCEFGFYGRNCTEECKTCKHNLCDQTTGNCLFGCTDGWFGLGCDQPCISNCSYCVDNKTCSICIEGLGGDDCSVKCPNTCESCSLGRYCDYCKNGYEVPSYNCTCSKQKCTKYGFRSDWNETVCEECEVGTGWFNIFGTCCPCLHCNGGVDQCSPTGKCMQGCDPGYYLDPFGCPEWCDIPHCVWCEQRHNKIPSVGCVGCEEGWYVYDHRCAHCSDKCSLNACDNLTGICKYGCNGGWYGDDCSKQCDLNCSSCNRLDDSCLVCPVGKWGFNCNESCIENCSICSIDSGDCLSCKAGFYGENCSETCENCKQSFCLRDSGNCTFGCKEGWYGNRCDDTCSTNCASCQDNTTCFYCKGGFWGPLCENDCPHTCPFSCSVISGNCTECVQDMYGQKCENNCSNNCNGTSNSTVSSCDFVSGRCLHGCSPGWHGDFCARKCSTNCLGKACSHISGECLSGCIDGWKGRKCSDPEGFGDRLNTGVIVGATVAGVLAVFVIIIGIVCLFNKHNSTKYEME